MHNFKGVLGNSVGEGGEGGDGHHWTNIVNCETGFAVKRVLSGPHPGSSRWSLFLPLLQSMYILFFKC